MGINGLLPFLKKSSRRANVREFHGLTAAIDAYCWLHKGAFSCAEKLVMNEPTTMYITYCMKLVNMLLSHNIKPILVFDGRYLPAKEATEKKRRETREMNLKKGAELLSAGRVEEGRSYLKRSVDITHEMAHNLIKACRNRNIDYIVAPYEADAQLAYLNIKNIAQLVITEDSDLLLFGCIRVLFKMDVNGDGILIEKDRLHMSMGLRHDNFSIEKFRYMCILSGCDYLPSLRGIGLMKACKFINRTSEQNIYEALLKLPVNLQMWTLVVTDDYRQSFIEADKAFKYQLVYDPIERKQVPLNETKSEDDLVGSKLDDDTAFQLAIGNIHPIKLKRIDNYNPDQQTPQAKNMNVTTHRSIWSGNFIPPKIGKKKNFPFAVHTPTKGLCISAKVSLPKKRSNDGSVLNATDSFLDENFSAGEKLSLEKCCPSEQDLELDLKKEYQYYIDARETTKSSESVGEALQDESETTEEVSTHPATSPVLFEKKNPFGLSSKTAPAKKSGQNCLGALKKFKLALESDNLVSSRYFNSEEGSIPGDSPAVNNAAREDNLDVTFVEERSHNDGVSPGEKESITEQESNPDLDVSASIRSKLSKFSLLSELNSSALNDECDLEECSQQKNTFTSSNEGKIENESTKPETPDEKLVLNCGEQGSTIPKSPKRATSREKIFYGTGADDAETSPYFSASKNSLHVVPGCKVQDSPVRSLGGRFPVQKTRKSSLKNVLNKSDGGKRQSMLTSFGFSKLKVG